MCRAAKCEKRIKKESRRKQNLHVLILWSLVIIAGFTASFCESLMILWKQFC
jgi:hypothetical protein